MQRDLRCRLAVPFVYVPRFYISWDWRPDPLARWSTLIPSSSRLLKWIAPAGNSVRAGGRRQIAFVKLGLV
jgi:hypothetical protein